MSKKERAKSIVIFSVMLLYIIMLLSLMLFSFGGAIRSEQRGINIVPFRSIVLYLPYLFSSSHSLTNLLGNIVMFTPLGVFSILLLQDKRVLPNLACTFLFSLAVEILQYIFARGISDIDDIILNCLGGLFGILIYKALLGVLKSEAKVRTAIAIASVIVLPLILRVFWGSVHTYISYMKFVG